MSLNEVFTRQSENKYDAAVKPAVDIDLSICTPEQQPRMIALVNRLAKSPCGLETLEIARDGGFTFSFFDGNTRCCGACDEAGKWIKLNPAMTDEKLVGTLCHEARHAGQFVRGAHEGFGVQDVRSELILFRSMEADAQTYAVTACQELAEQGDRGPYLRFQERYPEIERAFSTARAENGGVVNHDVMTATFKGWYDQNRIKTVYEESYQVEPMLTELSKLMVGHEPSYKYDRKVSGADAVAMAGWTKNGNYFTDDPAVLETGKYVEVADTSLTAIRNFFKARETLTGMAPDTSIEGLPTRRNPLPPKEIKDYSSAQERDVRDVLSVKKRMAEVSPAARMKVLGRTSR